MDLEQIIQEELEKIINEGIGTGALIGGALMAAAMSGDNSSPQEIVKDTMSDEEKKRIAAELVKKIQQNQDKGFKALVDQWEAADNLKRNKPATNLGWDPDALGEMVKDELENVLNEEGTPPTAVGLPNDIGTPEKLLAGLRALDIKKTDYNQANVIVNFINKSLMDNPSENVANALRDYKEKIADHHKFRKQTRRNQKRTQPQPQKDTFSSERDYLRNPFGIVGENLGEDIIPPELRARFKDTFTKVPGAEGSLSGGKISNMPRAQAAWSDLGKQIDTSKPEQIKQFHTQARLQIDLQKYMDNIKYAQDGERLGSIIYSLRDAIALSLPPASRRAYFKGDKRNRPPQFTRESQMSLEEIVEQELNFALDEKRKKKKKKKKKGGKKDACYHKVKSRYKVWPSAYASGALVKCRKVGAKNWGNSKKESVQAMVEDELVQVLLEKKKDKTLKSKVISALRKEGGAAGMDALKKHTGASAKEISKVVDSSANIKVHKDGDIILMDSLDESHSKEHEQELKKIAKELRGASKMHAGQADRIDKILDETDDEELKEEEDKKEKDDKKKKKSDKPKLRGIGSTSYEKTAADYKKHPSFFNEGMNCGCGKDPCETFGRNSEKISITIQEELENYLEESLYYGLIEEDDVLEEKKKKKKACKPSKGKKFARRVKGRCVSYGQAGKAKGGGARIKPGTGKGNAYCARSYGDMKSHGKDCSGKDRGTPLCLSRQKWKCSGKYSRKGK